MQSLDAHTQMQLAAEGRDWFGLARAVLVFDYERSSLGRYLLTLLVGAVWVGIVGQFAGFGKRRFILYGAALLLGVMSASATLFVVVIQENIRGFTMGEDMWSQLVYCIAGIGLREETIKLVFFAPLVPFVLRRPEIEGLVVAAFVGLGFALQENVGYYLGRDFSPWSRFFTANFFHLAITGILGLALVQFVRWPRTRWEELLATFLAVVVVHGVYDAFLLIPELIVEFSIFVLLILALIAYRFFDQAEHLAHPDRSRVISPLGVFVLGATLLGGVVMISSCWGMSFNSALVDFVGSGLGIFPVVFVFINRFRDA
jgi:RsiW-degrading membrane proteinase PrsW (M82 family)